MGRKQKPVNTVSRRERFLQRHGLESCVGYSPNGKYIGKYSVDTGILRYAGPDYGNALTVSLYDEIVYPVKLLVIHEYSDDSKYLDSEYWGFLRYRDGAIVGVYMSYYKASSFWRDSNCIHGKIGEFVSVSVTKQ